MVIKFFLIIVMSCFLSVAFGLRAQAGTPLQIALVHPVQLVDDLEDVNGLRLNVIYGDNFNVSGLDLGLVNKVTGDQKGVQIGLFNDAYSATGLQVGLFNRTEWLDGVQIGLVNIHKNGKYEFLPIVNFSF